MEGVATLEGGPTSSALVELHLIGQLRASTAKHKDILPNLRKARALFVILALSDQQNAPRRFLAGLLWSRYDPAQALARLRDTLRTLRQSLADTLGETEILDVTADRVGLRPGFVRVANTAALPDPGLLSARNDIALDLAGIDPALDEWLRDVRGRLLTPVPGPAPRTDEEAGGKPATHSPKRNSVLGVTVRTRLGRSPTIFSRSR